jgi:hypothetical protein
VTTIPCTSIGLIGRKIFFLTLQPPCPATENETTFFLPWEKFPEP